MLPLTTLIYTALAVKGMIVRTLTFLYDFQTIKGSFSLGIPQVLHFAFAIIVALGLALQLGLCSLHHRA
jgi:hypothetical protein